MEDAVVPLVTGGSRPHNCAVDVGLRRSRRGPTWWS